MRTKNGEDVSLISCTGGCERLVHDAAQLVQAAASFPPWGDGDAWSTIHERHPFYRTNAMSFAEELTILPPFSARDAMLPDRTRDLDGNVPRINTSAARAAPPTFRDLPAQSLQHEDGGTRVPVLHDPRNTHEGHEWALPTHLVWKAPHVVAHPVHTTPADVAQSLRRMQDMLRQEVTPTPSNSAM